MQTQNIYTKIGRLKVIPVIAIEDVKQAVPLADALIEGGLPIAEITFRTDAAAEVIQTLRKERSDLLVGAGTILTIENLKKAKECGAVFGVAPGFNRRIVEEALRLNFPFSPGIMTPSDVEAALELGVNILKFFPAEAAGGVKYMTSLAAPYAHTGVQFIPTGGIHPGNFKDYICSPYVLAVGGTWVAKRELFASGGYNKIKQNCIEITKAVKESEKS